MSFIARSGLCSGVLIVAWLASAVLPASAGENEEVGALWEKYTGAVGARDEMTVLTCYGKEIYKQLAGDNTAAGRARLDVHMGEMFDLLCRSYEYKIVSEEESGGKVYYNIKFKQKQKHDVHTCKVAFAEEDGNWKIIQAPEGPEFLSAGSGTAKMVAGIVIALGVVVFLVKKALG
jgi:hypothetical protein